MNMLEASAEGDWAGLQIERVPEPSTLALATIALLSLMGFGWWRRRRH